MYQLNLQIRAVYGCNPFQCHILKNAHLIITCCFPSFYQLECCRAAHVFMCVLHIVIYIFILDDKKEDTVFHYFIKKNVF